jgi:hypothetical protein
MHLVSAFMVRKVLPNRRKKLKKKIGKEALNKFKEKYFEYTGD